MHPLSPPIDTTDGSHTQSAIDAYVSAITETRKVLAQLLHRHPLQLLIVMDAQQQEVARLRAELIEKEKQLVIMQQHHHAQVVQHLQLVEMKDL